MSHELFTNILYSPYVNFNIIAPHQPPPHQPTSTPLHSLVQIWQRGRGGVWWGDDIKSLELFEGGYTLHAQPSTRQLSEVLALDRLLAK